MKLRHCIPLTFVLLALLTACQPAAPLPPTATQAAPTATLVPTITPTPRRATFDGEQAYQDVLTQLEFGPRTPGSPAHEQIRAWMASELENAGWRVETQSTEYGGQPVRNVIGKRGSGAPWTILGAHYDSRMVADQDPNPDRQTQPVPGANDGASGVAVLLELARTLPPETPGTVWLAFFDAEDQGRLPGWDWILGSRAFAESLTEHPDAVVIVDMIGDANLNVHYEVNSDRPLRESIWAQAAALGYEDVLIPQEKFNMLDDHTPFLELGIPAVDLIDFDYPFWHTTGDTADKVSPGSLTVIGNTLHAWLLAGGPLANPAE